MKLSTKLIIGFLVSLFLCLFSAWMGANYAASKYSRGISDLQADMAFNSLNTYTRLEFFIKKECIASAEDYIQLLIKEKKMILSEYFAYGSALEFQKKLKMKDPDLHDELIDYVVDWSTPKKVAPCK